MKHLQIQHLTKLFYLEYVENSQNLSFKKNPVRKSEKDICIHFTKNEIWMANKHKKILSFTTRHMQIKINVKYH